MAVPCRTEPSDWPMVKNYLSRTSSLQRKQSLDVVWQISRDKLLVIYLHVSQQVPGIFMTLP